MFLIIHERLVIFFTMEFGGPDYVHSNDKLVEL